MNRHWFPRRFVAGVSTKCDIADGLVKMCKCPLRVDFCLHWLVQLAAISWLTMVNYAAVRWHRTVRFHIFERFLSDLGESLSFSVKSVAIRHSQLNESDLMELLSKADVASYLGVTIRTIDNLVLRGELPPPRHIGRRVYWLKEEFNNHIRDCLCGAQNK